MTTWRVRPATGNMLEDLLNDMEVEGYDVFQIDFNGTMEQPNRFEPNSTTVMPLYTVIFRQQMKAVLDA